MEYKRLGKSDVMVSSLVLGCWELGGDFWGEYDQNVAYDYIHKAYELGINTFDTAEQYGRGYSEEVLGKMLSDLPRDKVNIMSKLWFPHVGKDTMEAGVDGMLKRLQTDYLDVCFMHYPHPEIPYEETIGEMIRLKEKGKIRAVGFSNFNTNQLKRMVQHGQVDVVQPCFNMLWRFADKEGLLQYCMEQDIGVVTYSALAQGLLTGAFNRDSKPSKTQEITVFWQPEWYPKAMNVTDEVIKMGEKYGKPAAQIALNFVVNTPGITAPIVGVANSEQIIDNLSVLDWKLEKADYDYLDKISKEFAYQLPRYWSMFETRLEKEVYPNG